VMILQWTTFDAVKHFLSVIFEKRRQSCHHFPDNIPQCPPICWFTMSFLLQNFR
jgi:hypothetical protein